MALNSNTPCPEPPYLIASRTCNGRRILISLCEMVAEMHFLEQAFSQPGGGHLQAGWYLTSRRTDPAEIAFALATWPIKITGAILPMVLRFG